MDYPKGKQPIQTAVTTWTLAGGGGSASPPVVDDCLWVLCAVLLNKEMSYFRVCLIYVVTIA